MRPVTATADVPGLSTGTWLEINNFCCYMPSPGRGVGVFALKALAAGQVILRDLARRIPGGEKSHLLQTSVRSHLFVDRDQKKSGVASPDFHMVFGASSILNHADPANCDIRWLTYRGFPVVETFSLREIIAGEELFYKYEDLDDYSVRTFV